MDRTRTQALYFNWLRSKVGMDGKYGLLLEQLHKTEFTHTIPLDENRAEDGIDLRYRFADEYLIPHHQIAAFIDTRPCSVLEMMVALSLRIEEEIMDDPEYGNRTSRWFMTMLQNLHVDRMLDRRYDRGYVKERVRIFLEREYDRDGDGSLFCLEHPRRNMRHVEIWYQAMWYLNEIQGGRKNVKRN